MMKDVVRDGKPHSAVGMEVTGNYVRTGVATAYPHPNQFFHAPVKRGQPLYVNCDILLGGYGGEGYRNYILLPSTPQHDRMWNVVRDTVQIIVEETKPGAVCSEIAYKVHQYQIKQGMQDYIYHRPGHGQGQNFVGHQPPFLALGDDTVVRGGDDVLGGTGALRREERDRDQSERSAGRAQGPIGPHVAASRSRGSGAT